MEMNIPSKFLDLSFVFALGILCANYSFGGEYANEKAVNNLLGTLNSNVYNHYKDGGMTTTYKYTFAECQLFVHSEYYGLEHSEIDDNTIPITLIDLSKEIDQDKGQYYLFMKCKNGKDCIRIKGESTGDPHDYMFIQHLIYAGKSERSYNKIRVLFDQVISECNISK